MTTVFTTPGHGELSAFQPGAGIAMGYDDLKVIEASRFLQSIAQSKPRGATINDAVRAAQVLDAIVESAANGRWVNVES
jgi:predicted dehydrogenase